MLRILLMMIVFVLGSAAVRAQTYPGNGSDVRTAVAVNGVAQPATPGVHLVSGGDVVVFTFTSPGATLSNQPFLAFWQLFATGTPPPPDPTLGLFFDAALITGIIADGFSNPAQVFNPLLDGFIAGGPIPPVLSGTMSSVLVNCVTIDLTIVPFNFGIADAHEIRIN